MTYATGMRRTRGGLSGLLLIVLGAWGALIPFVGPYFHYAYTPDRSWAYTSGRLWLEVVPGAATVLGGLIVLLTRSRLWGGFGAFLAALGGAWFVVGAAVTAQIVKSGSIRPGRAGRHVRRSGGQQPAAVPGGARVLHRHRGAHRVLRRAGARPVQRHQRCRRADTGDDGLVGGPATGGLAGQQTWPPARPGGPAETTRRRSRRRTSTRPRPASTRRTLSRPRRARPRPGRICSAARRSSTRPPASSRLPRRPASSRPRRRLNRVRTSSSPALAVGTSRPNR